MKKLVSVFLIVLASTIIGASAVAFSSGDGVRDFDVTVDLTPKLVSLASRVQP